MCGTHVSDVKGILLSVLTRAGKLGKICARVQHFTPPLMVHDAPSVFPDLFLARRRSRSHCRYSISDGSTRPAPYGGFNEPIKLSLYMVTTMDTVSPFSVSPHFLPPFPRVLSSWSTRFTSSIFLFAVSGTRLPSFLVSVIACASLCGLSVSSRFWSRRILCTAWNCRFNDYNCRWDFLSFLDLIALDIN